MIILLAASSITLTALQASINAPRDAFKACLKQASEKASGEKVGADAYEAYVRKTCDGQLGSFKSATVSFDMKNKMSHKAASEDADSMIADFVSSSLEHYKYIAKTAPVAEQAAAPATAKPQPTPAAQPK
jgi:hypothetical protein